MKIERLTGALGARISGIELSAPLGPDVVAAIQQAINSFGVLFFPDQPILTAEQNYALAEKFGEIENPPFSTPQSVHPQVLIVEFDKPKVGVGAAVWHQDGSHTETPPYGTFLQAHVLPSFGGDTCFSCMYSAYDALHPAMQTMLDQLTATHSIETLKAHNRTYKPERDGYSIEMKPPVSHPVVTVNPLTGRKRLFINSLYTLCIDGMSKSESDYLLRFLLEHVKSPEFQLRYHWSVGDLAFWDNMAVQHFAVADYNERRRMQRVLLKGERPQGVR